MKKVRKRNRAKSLINGAVTVKSEELKDATSLNITGDVDEAGKKLIGNRPIFEITITAGSKEMKKLSNGNIMISIPYTPVNDENAVVRIFSDVPEGHWAKKYIRYLSEKEILSGRTETIFAPSDPITRAEMAAIQKMLLGR